MQVIRAGDRGRANIAPRRPGTPRVRTVARTYMIPPARGGTTCPTAGRPVYSGPGRQAEQRRSVVGDRRDEERDRREREDAKRREEDERRSDELREAWRRNHPSRPEEDDGRKKGKA